MKQITDVTIIIPTRANLSFLEAAVNSIRSKSQYDTCKILIGADNPTKEVSLWLAENSKGKFDYQEFIDDDTGRLGIVSMVEELINSVKTKYVFYMHDDMIIGEHTLENLLNQITEKVVLSAKRVEPPLYPETPEKFIRDFGFSPEDFKEDIFLEFEQMAILEDAHRTVEGFFAPHLFKTEDWVGYDQLFKPQSREDSDLALRFTEEGFKLLTVQDALVYHFSGKGSRKKEGNNDSVEWKKSNYKNTNNYIRKWGTLKHTQYILPMKAPKIPISAHVLVGEEKERMFNFLNNIEPWFDEIIMVFDTEHADGSKEEVERYIQFQEQIENTNFKREKIKIFDRPLNQDFASQTNFAVEQCTNDWTIKLDVDEVFSQNSLSELRFILDRTLQDNENIEVLGFPRINFLDGKISNDIPREHWFTEHFDKYPQKPKDINNYDIQFRLHKKTQKWVGKVHEVPEAVLEKDVDKIRIVTGFEIQHPKNRKRQFEQEKKYSSISRKNKKNISKIVYDSVLFTHEGITKHAREEIKQLLSKEYDIFILDNNYQSGFGEEFKNLYNPFVFYGPDSDEYVTIVNQPPTRWEKTKGYKNRIGYLAFEGKLNNEWVKIINESDIIELWTPSQYCKKMFEESGITKEIIVVPHGVDPQVWKPLEKENNNKFTFLAAGTFHNQRKGLDLVAKAFNEEFTGQDDVELIFKINKIYNPHEGFNKYIKKYISQNGNTSIYFNDENLSEKELVTLYNEADCFVSAHRCLDENTNIYTNKGVKKIKDVKIGDNVLTHKGRWKQVTNTFKNKLNGRNMFNIKTNSFDTLITEDHPVLTMKRTPYWEKPNNIFKTQTPEWTEVKNIRQGDWVAIPKKEKTDELVTQKGYENGKFVGFYLSEGCSNEKGDITFTFHTKEKEYYTFIEEFLKKNSKNNVRVRHLDRNRTTISVTDISLSRQLSQFGKRSWEKTLPHDIFTTQDKGYVRGLIEGLFKGDGYIPKRISSKNRKIFLETVSKDLMMKTRLLLNLYGIGSNITTQKRKPKDARDSFKLQLSGDSVKKLEEFIRIEKSNTKHWNTQYVETEDYFWYPIRDITILDDYDKKYVYTIEVQDDHSYMTEHFIVKNCEGFGINILNALAAGVPVIATEATGNLDFCNKKNTLFVDVEKEVWSDWMPPYEKAKWVEPSLESLKQQMRKAYNDREALSKRGREKVSKKIHDEWSWDKTADIIDERIKKL